MDTTGVQACARTHTHTHTLEPKDKTTPFFVFSDNYSYVYFGNELGLLNRGLQQDDDFTKCD